MPTLPAVHTPLAIAAAALALSSLVVTPAPACGMPPARVFLVLAPSTHPARQFVMLSPTADAPAAGDRAWHPIAPRTYDSTMITAAPALPARTFTLVGTLGTRVVSTTAHVFIAPMVGGQALNALEIATPASDLGNLRFAIAGHFPDATWTAAAVATTTPEATAWYVAHAPDLRGAVTVERVADVELLVGLTDAGTLTIVRRGTEELGRFDAYPDGLLTYDGMRLIEGEHDDRIRTVALY